MEYIISRHVLPEISEEFEKQPRYNLWTYKYWPYVQLKSGDTLYWYQSSTKNIVWKTRVVAIDRFPYDVKQTVQTRLSRFFGNFDSSEKYYLKATSHGYCLAWKIKALQRVDFPKPQNFKFHEIGWLSGNDDIAVQWLSHSNQNILEEIKACKNSYKHLPETERKAIIDSRLGQGQFRTNLLQFWNGCAVTKCMSLEVLAASHIKPWKDSNNRERLDKPQKCVKTVFLKMSATRLNEQLLAKTKFSGQAQFFDSLQGLQELFALMIIFGQKQNILTAMFGQLVWQNQEVGANRIQGRHPVIFGQTNPFEPVNYIGGKQKQLKECHVGLPGKVPDVKGATLIYSQWDGYIRDKRKTAIFWDFVQEIDLKIEHIHTSGHATVDILKQLARALRPKHVIPIHTEHPEKFKECFGKSVMVVEDGQLIEI
jgi:hypothetical protein